MTLRQQVIERLQNDTNLSTIKDWGGTASLDKAFNHSILFPGMYVTAATFDSRKATGDNYLSQVISESVSIYTAVENKTELRGADASDQAIGYSAIIESSLFNWVPVGYKSGMERNGRSKIAVMTNFRFIWIDTYQAIRIIQKDDV